MRRGQSVTLALVLALSVAFATSHVALASVSTKQVSVTRRGGDPYKASFYPSVSADGRFVAFRSEAGNLVPDDHTIRWPDISSGTQWRGRPSEPAGHEVGIRTTRATTPPSARVRRGVLLTPPTLCRRTGTGTPTFSSGTGGWNDGPASVTLRAGTGWRQPVPSSAPTATFPPLWRLRSGPRGREQSGGLFVGMVAGTTGRASVDTQGGDPNGSWGRLPAVPTVVRGVPILCHRPGAK